MTPEEAKQANAWATRVLSVQDAFMEYRAAIRARLIAFRTGATQEERDKRAQSVSLALGTLNRAIDQEMQAEAER